MPPAEITRAGTPPAGYGPSPARRTDVGAFARVDAVAVATGPDGPRVRAVVHLGALSPADVCVELLHADQGDDAGADLQARPARRMWSSHPYHNGCYLFESALPAEGRYAADDWEVRVRRVDTSRAAAAGTTHR